MSLSFTTCEAEVEKRTSISQLDTHPGQMGESGASRTIPSGPLCFFFAARGNVQSRCRVGTDHGCCPYTAWPPAECSLPGDLIRFSTVADGATLPSCTLQFSSSEDDKSRLENATWKEQTGTLKRRERNFKKKGKLHKLAWLNALK